MHKISNKLLNKYRAIPVQVKASLWFALCSFIQKGLSIITVPIFTRVMSTEQYGMYTTYISWFNLLLVFTSLNLYYGVFNNAMLKYRDRRAQYISSVQGLVFTITTAFFILYLIFQQKANEMLGMTTPMVMMLFLELLFSPCLHFWMAEKRFEYKYKAIVIVTLVKSIANPILGLILVINTEQKDLARIISIASVEAAIASVIAVIQFRRGKVFFSKEFWKYSVWFNLPLIPHYLSGQILSQSDRIMINKMVGNTAVAIYGVSYNIGLLLNIFTTAINGSYTPWFYQTLEKKNYSQIKQVTRIIVLLMGCLVTMLMLFGPELISILGSDEYREGVYCIPPVAAGAFFIFLYNIYANVEFYFEKRFYVLISSIIAAVLNLVLNFIFISQFGYIAAAYTTLVSYIVFCLMHNTFASYICKKESIPADLFIPKTILLISASVVGISLLMNLLYLNNYVRYGVIAAGAIVILVFWKKIAKRLKETFKTIRTKDKKSGQAETESEVNAEA